MGKSIVWFLLVQCLFEGTRLQPFLLRLLSVLHINGVPVILAAPSQRMFMYSFFNVLPNTFIGHKQWKKQSYVWLSAPLVYLLQKVIFRFSVTGQPYIILIDTVMLWMIELTVITVVLPRTTGFNGDLCLGEIIIVAEIRGIRAPFFWIGQILNYTKNVELVIIMPIPLIIFVFNWKLNWKSV